MKITYGDSYSEDYSAIRDCREVISGMEDNEDVNNAPIASWDCAETAYDVYECEPSETGIAIIEAFIAGADPYPMLAEWKEKIRDHDYPEEERVFDLQYAFGSTNLTGWVTKYGPNKFTAFIGDISGILDRINLTHSEYREFKDTMNDLFDGQAEFNFNSIFPMRRFVRFGDFEHTEREYLDSYLI